MSLDSDGFMRLAAKLVLLFLVGMLLIVALFSYLTIQLDRRLAISEHQRHAAELADAVRTVAGGGALPNLGGGDPHRGGLQELHAESRWIVDFARWRRGTWTTSCVG